MVLLQYSQYKYTYSFKLQKLRDLRSALLNYANSAAVRPCACFIDRADGFFIVRRIKIRIVITRLMVIYGGNGMSCHVRITDFRVFVYRYLYI